jgi:hypothetical protein
MDSLNIFRKAFCNGPIIMRGHPAAAIPVCRMPNLSKRLRSALKKFEIKKMDCLRCSIGRFSIGFISGLDPHISIVSHASGQGLQERGLPDLRLRRWSTSILSVVTKELGAAESEFET